MRLSKTRVPACDPENNDEVISAEQAAAKQTFRIRLEIVFEGASNYRKLRIIGALGSLKHYHLGTWTLRVRTVSDCMPGFSGGASGLICKAQGYV